MAASVVGADSRFGNQKFRAAMTDVFAGAICSVLSIAYCLSYAALIFTGPLENLLAYGVAVTFLSAAVGGAVVALRSSIPFAIAGPDSSISVVLAAMVATLVQRLVADGGNHLLEPTLIALSLSTALTGGLLCVLGYANAGRAIRFVPYPVIGGFLGATGWLMITGAIQVIADQRPTFFDLDAFASGPIIAKLAAGAAIVIVLHMLLPRVQSAFVLPGVLLAAIASYAYCLAGVRRVAGRRASGRLAIPATGHGRPDAAVETDRTRSLSVDGIALACRRSACRGVRYRHHATVEHDRDRDSHANRG